MAPRSRKDLKVKTKEVKIPHLTNANKKKMEVWGLGGLFAVEWSQTYEDLVEELAGHSNQKVAVLKYEYRGKPGAWTSDVLREVYNLPKASPGGYVMKGKVQFTELQLLRLVKGDRWQTVFDSEIEAEDEKEPKEEFPHTAWVGEASGSKLLDKKTTVDFNEWEVRLQNLGWKISKLFEAFHVDIASVTAEAVARNMEQIFSPPPVVEVDIQPWKEMVKNLINLLTAEQKKNREVIEQHDYLEGKLRRSEKVPEIVMWCVQQL
ncbi:hypothetical protein R1flu_011364 [Riccia fluitans]|uniref:Uncharacterized protein n=1 Tax=Riccia fluitans TaxID=41844 RepID=A0ABD1ZAU5_9MARC